MKKWTLICSGLLFWMSATAHAQGLIWSLPQDGEWVRYEGTYSEEIKRPDSPQGDLKLEWRRVTSIKSVGTEEAEYQGENQACRWIEIKSETGKAAEGVLETGPGGVRLYKILVPESAIRGEVVRTVADDRKIHVAFVPVVKGYRKIDNLDVEAIESGVFDLFPVISLLRHYQGLQETGDSQSIQLPTGSVDVVTHHGEMVTETTTERTTNVGDLQRSDKIPFGIAAWTAKATVENKGSTDARDNFKETLTVSENMQAAATGDGAQSEITEK